MKNSSDHNNNNTENMKNEEHSLNSKDNNTNTVHEYLKSTSNLFMNITYLINKARHFESREKIISLMDKENERKQNTIKQIKHTINQTKETIKEMGYTMENNTVEEEKSFFAAQSSSLSEIQFIPSFPLADKKFQQKEVWKQLENYAQEQRKRTELQQSTT